MNVDGITSNIGSPVNLDNAAISKIIVPAQAVHVSRVCSIKFCLIPYFKFTYKPKLFLKN